MASQEELQAALNELRLLVLMECEDGKFRALALDPAQFKKVSDAVVSHTDPDSSHVKTGKELVYIHLNAFWAMDADNFLGLGSITPHNDAECEACPNEV